MKDTLTKTFFGAAGTATSLIASYSKLEVGLRITTEFIGVIVALLSAVSLALKVRRQWRGRNSTNQPTPTCEK